MNDMDELYREVILDHYKDPRCKGSLEKASVIAEGKNPLCGDELTLYLGIDDKDCVAEVAWDGHGCSICMASASMLAEQIEGGSIEEAQTKIEAVIQMMHGHPIPESLDVGDIPVLEGVKKFPVRIKCALLPWTTLQEGIKNHDRNNQQRITFSY
jgi:nitrogen fixation protein NifU and related proteins